MNEDNESNAPPEAGEDDNRPIGNIDAIMAIPVDVQVVLGTTTMPVAALMKLGRNAIITLDQRVGEAVTVMVNGKVIARGEMVVVDEDNSKFGVALTEIVASAGN